MFDFFRRAAMLAIGGILAVPHVFAAHAADPVYQGRAVFSVAAPEFPASYHGLWALDRADCAALNSANTVIITASGYQMGDGAMAIKRARINRADAPYHSRLVLDVVYEGGGGSEAATVIIQKSPDGLMFSLWQRGEDQAKAVKFHRCLAKTVGGR